MPPRRGWFAANDVRLVDAAFLTTIGILADERVRHADSAVIARLLVLANDVIDSPDFIRKTLVDERRGRCDSGFVTYTASVLFGMGMDLDLGWEAFVVPILLVLLAPLLALGVGWLIYANVRYRQ